MFRVLRSGPLTLHLIDTDNLPEVVALLQGYPDSWAMLDELFRHYLPTYDGQGRRTTYGCYVRLRGELAGLVVLAVDDWDTLSGSLGADVLTHMRGRGVAPGTKPHLFHLAFGLLGLNRVAPGTAFPTWPHNARWPKRPASSTKAGCASRAATSRASWKTNYSTAFCAATGCGCTSR